MRAGAEGTALPPTLTLNLFDDVVLSALVDRSVPTASGAGYVLSGRLDAAEPGTWRLLVYEDAVAGTVDTADATYNIRTVDGVHVISEVELASPPFQDIVVPLPDHLRESSPDAGFHLPRSTDAPITDGDGEAVVDVAVVYTEGTAARAGRLHGDAGIDAFIDMMFDSTNQAYERSGAMLRIRLALKDVLPCVGDVCSDYRSLLDGLGGRERLRDTSGADLLSWIVDTPDPDAGGRAYLGGSYSIVNFDAGSFAFAHELGHNMHLRHDRWTVLNVDEYKVLNDPHPYNHGYVSRTCDWHTIMAYPNRCNRPVLRLYAFSNPNKYHNGERMGVPGSQITSDVDGPADATRTLNGPADATRTLNELRWEVANRKELSPTSARGVLQTFYHAAGGRGWMERTNWLSAAPLWDWFGVDAGTQVLGLKLARNGLSGRLPAELRSLAGLQWESDRSTG